MRVGDEVRLRWTTPAHTTDGLNLAGVTTAEVCREAVGAVAAAGKSGGKGCSPVLQMVVKPGSTEAVDRLPGGLAAGPSGLLGYRVMLRNGAGRTAGASGVAYAASGAAPGPVEGLRVKAAKAGAVVEWTAGGREGDFVELDRVMVDPPTVAAAAGKGGLLAAEKEPVEGRFRAEDVGGAMDRTAAMGKTYRYTAQRVRTVTVGGKAVEVRGVVSGAETVAMVDVFPPEVPVGLVSSPEFVGEVAAIDLSWEPGMEAGIAGYKVYRRAVGGEWVRVSSELVTLPAYRDATVVAGRRYGYRVTAVDAAGNESGPSGEVMETAPVR